MIRIYLLSVLVTFALSLLFCFFIIPILKRWKAEQNILKYVEEHKEKKGTPTMGGIAFITASVLGAVIFIFHIRPVTIRSTILTLVIGVSYMIIGLLDDYLKKRHKDNLGLKAWQKLVFQTLVAIFCAIYCVRAQLTKLYIPFLNVEIHIGLWILPLIIFVFLATVNAVNLTDGLDGLAAGTCVPFFLALGILIVLQNGDRGMALISFCLVGGLLAYLLFNVSPAKVFMGDTGSLSLGGFASAIACFTGNTLYIAVIGGCFVLSVISDIIQVIYYKVTHGKRWFLMAPFHHHLQKKGYSECHISYLYFLVTLILGAICVYAALG